jgi:alpha-L-fucosidase
VSCPNPMGDWFKVNSEAIYGCGGTAWCAEYGDYRMVEGKRVFVLAPANWRCTTMPGKVYIHVLNWPKDGRLELPGLNGRVLKAHLVADSASTIQIERTSEQVLLTLPVKSPDAAASVVCLTNSTSP